jgi:hypothetical protein
MDDLKYLSLKQCDVLWNITVIMMIFNTRISRIFQFLNQYCTFAD